jgi:hypothetical protein
MAHDLPTIPPANASMVNGSANCSVDIAIWGVRRLIGGR